MSKKSTVVKNNGLQMPVGQALQAAAALQKTLVAPLDAVLAYEIGKLLARLQINPDLMAAETARAGMARKYAGDQPQVPDDKRAAFGAELQPVMLSPVAIDTPLLPVTLRDLTKMLKEEGIKVTGLELLSLEPFCKKEEE